MIKTLNVKEEVSITELLKYVEEGKLPLGRYRNSVGEVIELTEDYLYYIDVGMDMLTIDSKFKVDITKEIDSDTVFDCIHFITGDEERGYNSMFTTDVSINDIQLDSEDRPVKMYARIKGELQLIWEDER